jgi:prepilin-type N-terminal cleavage/methylation domain-containing protein
MKSSSPIRKFRRGFTLIELSVAMSMGMFIGAMVLALFNQQLAFLKIYHKQSFLTEEAPMISMYVSRLIGKADRFTLHDSVADAIANRNSSAFSPPKVVRLYFRQVEQNSTAGVVASPRSTLLAFENLGSGAALNYYIIPSVGVLGPPQWAVTRKPKNVVFTMENGVLRMKLTGPDDEEIIYSGTMQQ